MFSSFGKQATVGLRVIWRDQNGGERRIGNRLFLPLCPAWPLGVLGRKSFCRSGADKRNGYGLEGKAERSHGKELEGPSV